MPSNLLLIDAGFPTFTGEESPKQQIRALHDYMFQLREGLEYSLRNLTKENFNAAALESMTSEQQSAVTEELKKVYALLNQMSAQIQALQGKVTNAEGLNSRVEELEEETEALGGWVVAVEQTAEEAEQTAEEAEQTAAEAKQTAAETAAALEALQGVVQVAEDGSITIGTADKPLQLIGIVSINGVPYTSEEETNETS